MKSIPHVLKHFQKYDPVIYSAVLRMEREPLIMPVAVDDFFMKLCRDILGQQLSGKAADAIVARFVSQFGPVIVPKTILAADETSIRNVGTSWAKVRSLKDLAEKVSKNEMQLHLLQTLPDEEVIMELTKVKGIGRWTAEMFLIFTLGREDVFSHGDLGLRKGLMKLYNLKDKPTIEEAEAIVSKWSPYRSYGSLALWDSLDNR